MGLLAFLRKRRLSIPDNPVLSRVPIFSRPRAGVRMNHDIALTMSAVWACVRLISESIAALPWDVYERKSNGGREEVENAIAQKLRGDVAPNLSSFTFREVLTHHALLWGNGYAEITRNANGVATLSPLAPDRMWPETMLDGTLVYRYKNPPGDDILFPADNIFHLKGLGFDGQIGYSVITMARESISLGLAMEGFGASWFGNGSRPSGLFVYPTTLTDETRDKVKSAFERLHAGVDNAGKTLVLEGGGEWKQISIPPEDGQFLESRKFQVEEIARIFRCPPHLIQSLENATYSNIEHQGIDFTTYCLGPWARRWETETDTKILGRQQRAKLFTRLNMSGLLRGDIKSRYEAYKIGIGNGILTINEARALEDLNAVDGGDETLVPMNMTTLSALKEKADNPPEPPPMFGGDQDPGAPPGNATDAASRDERGLQMKLLVDAGERIMKREVESIEKAFKRKRGREDRVQGLQTFYGSLAGPVAKILSAPVQYLAESSGIEPHEAQGVIDVYALQYCKRHLSLVEKVKGFDELRAVWEETLPWKIAAEVSDLVRGMRRT